MRRPTVILATALLASVSAPAGQLADGPDEFTDERRLAVEVAGQRGGALEFSCHRSPGQSVGMAVRPEPGLFHMRGGIEVKLRFDDREAESQRLYWNGVEAIHQDAKGFSDRALAAGRLIVKVGPTGTLRFDLAASRAELAEFAARCDAWWAEDGA